MSKKIQWGRYDFYEANVNLNNQPTSMYKFDFCGMVFRLKYNHKTGKFDIRKKSEIESICRERDANIVLRPPRKTKRKGLQGRLFLLKSKPTKQSSNPEP